jgi:hypothetical protein
MKDKNTSIRKAALALLLAFALLPLCAVSQTLRGDFNMDSQVNISDVIMMANYLSTGSLGEVTPAERDTLVVDGIPFVMVLVKGGTYTLKYGKVRTVPDFWIGQTEVTYGLWWAVMGRDSHPNGFNDHAVHFVTWYESQTFMEKLKELTGRNFRLPYADEWRYAASGGRLSRGYIYSGSDNIDEVAWYYDNDAIGDVQTNGIHAVALRLPNELGLYDMSGNVAEWVQEMRETTVVETGGVYRSAWLFGGWWGSDAKDCRPTSWVLDNPSSSAGTLRLAIPATDEPWQSEGWPDQY